MAGPDPAIHVLPVCSVDTRVKPGHDEVKGTFSPRLHNVIPDPDPVSMTHPDFVRTDQKATSSWTPDQVRGDEFGCIVGRQENQCPLSQRHGRT